MKLCSWLILSGVAAAFTACGGVPETEQAASGTAAEEHASEEGAVDGINELGTVEQAIGEATCGTGTPDRILSFTGSTIHLNVNPPYNNASCSQASLDGYKSTKATATFATSIRVTGIANQAACDAVTFKTLFFTRGSLVTSFNGGLHVFSSGGICTVTANYNFNPNNVGIRVVGNTVFIGASAPVAADNARFALQAVSAGTQKAIDITLF
jgi:hypothetical protein